MILAILLTLASAPAPREPSCVEVKAYVAMHGERALLPMHAVRASRRPISTASGSGVSRAHEARGVGAASLISATRARVQSGHRKSILPSGCDILTSLASG